MKTVLIRFGTGGALAALVLLTMLRGPAVSAAPEQPERKPLEVTYYFLPG